MNGPGFLVTGGTGSFGSRVVDHLRGSGREVRVLSRSGRPGTVRRVGPQALSTSRAARSPERTAPSM
jgi:uncharacterized protein YbjT (DUF2867 family)